jgi:hypothetical protein
MQIVQQLVGRGGEISIRRRRPSAEAARRPEGLRNYRGRFDGRRSHSNLRRRSHTKLDVAKI